MTPSEFDSITKLEADLWSAADNLRANSKLTSSEYCMPVLGIIFLRHASNRYETALKQIQDDQASGKMPKRKLVKADFIKRRALMLADLCESIDYGYTASATQEDIGPKFLRITDIVPPVLDWSSVPFCPIEDNRLEKFRLREGDIVIARTGATVGYAKRLNKLHPDAVFASYLVRLRLRPEVDNLLAGVFVESDDYKCFVRSRVGGAAQPNASAPVLAAAELLVPPPSIQQDFREFVEPMVDERELLQIQNQKLRIARDLLLPKLMSGEIEV